MHTRRSVPLLVVPLVFAAFTLACQSDQTTAPDDLAIRAAKGGKPVGLFVSSVLTDNVLQYDGATGAFIDIFASGGGLVLPSGLVFGPDGKLYVSGCPNDNALPDVVRRYHGKTGAFIDIFASGGGLNCPADLVFGPDGNLYVSSLSSHNILRYDGTTGAFIDIFASGGGLTFPNGLAFGPDGNLYVTKMDYVGEVLRYNGTTGAFIDIFVSDGRLIEPRSLVFGPDGHLYVDNFNDNEVLRYNGTTGAFTDIFASGGGLDGPNALVFGPDGHLYVSSTFTHNILRYDGTTGAFIDIFASGGGLNRPTGLVFGPSKCGAPPCGKEPGGGDGGGETPPRVKETDLSSVLGGVRSRANDVDGKGQIVGRITENINSRLTETAFLLTSGGSLVHIAENLGFDDSRALAISSRGEVVGAAIELSPFRQTAFVWSAKAGFRELSQNLPGFDTFVAEGISRAGVIVGRASSQATSEFRAVVWMSETADPTDVGPGSMFAISDNGIAVGWDRPAARATIWTASDGNSYLPRPPEQSGTSRAYDVNSSGDAVGFVEISIGCSPTPECRRRAVVWRSDGAVEFLGSLTTDGPSVALGISDKGLIVGEAEPDGGGRHAFLWTSSYGMIDLGDRSRAAEGVNDRGKTVGWGPPGEHARLWEVK